MDHEEIEHAAEPNLQFLRQKSKIRYVDLGFGVLHVFWIYKIIRYLDVFWFSDLGFV